MRRATITLAGVLIAAGCGRKPTPRTCSTEAPPPAPENGKIEIGMCTTDPPPAATFTDAAPADATNDGG